MRRRALVTALLLLASAGFSAKADVLDDPLHGYCAGAKCIDNGTNSPTTSNPLVNFGFTVSPGPAPETFVIDVLVPNNEPHPSSFAITGTLSGTATLFSVSSLDHRKPCQHFWGLALRPIMGSAHNLPSTQALDPGATGFFVYPGQFRNDHCCKVRPIRM